MRVPVREEPDVVVARRCAQELALDLGLADNVAAAVATAVSEVARNIIVHVGGGEVVLGVVGDGRRRGVVVIARDRGRGIADVERAMQDGYSTSGGLGLGLPGARRLMDEFELVSSVDEGTTVTMRKWVHGDAE
jgi:serine/threonine-protein kinase RsbT